MQDPVRFLRVGFAVGERRARRVLAVGRSTQRDRSRKDEQLPLRGRLRDLAASRVRSGYRRLHVLLQREGWPVHHQRVYRLDRQSGVGLQRRPRRKRAGSRREAPLPATGPRMQWGMDFPSDRLADGRRFRVRSFVDHVSRVSPAIPVVGSISGARVVEVLEAASRLYGLPDRISVDNGPGFASKALDARAYRRGVRLIFGRPGKPTDNAAIDALNSRFRDECLDRHRFASPEEARPLVEAWRIEDHTERPHGAVRQRTPAEFLAQWAKAKGDRLPEN